MLWIFFPEIALGDDPAFSFFFQDWRIRVKIQTDPQHHYWPQFSVFHSNKTVSEKMKYTVRLCTCTRWIRNQTWKMSTKQSKTNLFLKLSWNDILFVGSKVDGPVSKWTFMYGNGKWCIEVDGHVWKLTVMSERRWSKGLNVYGLGKYTVL